ncbi:glycosyltransferase family 39 protein [bacterium]|nr:glycosyltransferase family 39 protein [bacterium]
MVESNKTSLLIFFCLLYLSIACFLASQKLFWNDELYTLYFTRLAWPDLWWALGTGADQIPPTFVLLTKVFSSVFGVNQISIRMPEMMGFLLLCFCLYRIVSIRMSAAGGFLAMLLPTMTPAFSYAYEARPYALVLGFGACALLCWLAVGDRPRKLQMIGLGLSLSGAFLSHYSGILLFVPLILGEVIRIRLLKRIDYPVWITFILALLPVLLFLPLLRASASYGGGFWAKPKWGDIFLFYDYLLGPMAVFLVFVVLLSGVFWMLRASTMERAGVHSFRSHELTAILGFVAISPIAVIASKLLTGALTGRHALLSVIGFALLIPYGIYDSLGPKKLETFILPFFFAGFLGMAVANYYDCKEDASSYQRTVQFLQHNAETEIPIVSWFVHPAQQVWYYGPADLAGRLFYLADPEASLRYLGHDTIDRGMLNLKPWFPIKNVQPYERFTQIHKSFLLYYCSWEEDWRWNWIVSRLLADHFKIEMKMRQGDQFLFLVTPG